MTLDDFCDLITLYELDGAQSVLDVLYESHWPAPLAGKMVAVVQLKATTGGHPALGHVNG